ncbi:MAG: hypothetical protein K0R99_3778 [Microbacterium sp.]|jgi:hypothetical protein|uniref:hypothetical protein n=1 Tax=Microbacterium sp. TaxID=51671 RepID=UPI002635BCAF|nr:hypothetical protein [Microbacterium sp.]MDF2562332.1 hypothetical protein [Microbacterium sp.]
MSEPTQRRRRLGCGGLVAIAVLLAVVVLVGSSVVRSLGPQSACDEAYDARVLSVRLDDPRERDIAAMQYVVKAAECERAGGTVRE